jgi:polysaccharide chain length determinant protein (PEP-CTERM system associated)
VIPGKVYTPEEYVKIAWRYRWLILIPFVLAAAGTFAVSRVLPDRFRSETLILVVPQRVPEAYVKSTVTARIEDRLQSISQQILSRTRLERIIQDFNLYERERKTGIMEDLVERMRRDIEVQIVKGDAFRVAFTGQDPRTVMRVTERLASLFIDESLRDREVLAEGTNQFLEAQLEDARRQLVDHEKRLEEYRRKFNGQLPTQVDSNLSTIRSAELQLQATTDSFNRDRDQKALLERQIADLTAAEAPPSPRESVEVANDGTVGQGGTAAQQLEAARNALAGLQLRLTAQHPDVLRMKRVIRELEAKAEAEALARPLGGPVISAAERARQNRLNELKLEREAVLRASAAKDAEMKRLRGIINEYQARVEAAPTRESELVALTRDYDTIQKSYASLLAKREDSQIAANLERRQIGEQFKILDPARLPEKPASPNRPLINALGALAGLGIGLGLAILLEYKDTTLKSDNDVAVTLMLPVLASVPLIVTAADVKQRNRRRLLLSVAAATVVLIAVAALAAWKLRIV